MSAKRRQQPIQMQVIGRKAPPQVCQQPWRALPRKQLRTEPSGQGQRGWERDCGACAAAGVPSPLAAVFLTALCLYPQARVMATIGVTRGLGDHDLKVHDSNIYIKPFLSPAPEVPRAFLFLFVQEHVFCTAPPLTLAPHPGSGQRTSHALLHGLSRLLLFSPPLSRQPSWLLLHRLQPRRLRGLWHPCLLSPAHVRRQSSLPEQLL